MNSGFNLDKILRQLANDDKSALESLFNYYYPRLYRFSRSLLKLEEGIDDVLQEVFIKIWNHRKRISSTGSFNAFIFTITRNTLLNELRRQLNDQSNREQLMMASAGAEYEAFGSVEYDELKNAIDAVVKELPEKQQTIFQLSRGEGLSHKEIAEKLGVSTKTVEYHISQAIRVLKTKLKSFGFISVLYFYLFF